MLNSEWEAPGPTWFTDHPDCVIISFSESYICSESVSFSTIHPKNLARPGFHFAGGGGGGIEITGVIKLQGGVENIENQACLIRYCSSVPHK